MSCIVKARAAGARCRFARSSASQGSCIFPCRCTNGCHTTTGQCINGGQCTADKPDKPTDLGWRWTGIACQEGNVAYNKAASQSIGDWGGKYPAGRAVDGDTNPRMMAGHCAHPDTDWGKNAWWMVDLKDRYNISRVTIYNSTCNDVIGCDTCDPGKQQPDCTKELTCPLPPTIQHATVKANGLRYLDTTTYTCESGYRSSGQRLYLVCSKHATWEGEHIVCTDVSDYGHLTTVPREPDVPNIYDVISE
ncbi:hypothetical protein NP493_2083g00008 [Ridgeia piscesae]|uniref:Sushi domain-containing protein n=1 Tax=Ridgeia piscesae TaxID=27915 RepID=A0AAD9N550_RIDPI|nr:hypothetical protein NP493_2083g00008 [Ridgeia piscesae]